MKKEVYVDCLVIEREKGFEIFVYKRNTSEYSGRLFCHSKVLISLERNTSFSARNNGDFIFDEFYFMKYGVDLPNMQFSYLKLLTIRSIQTIRGFSTVKCSAKIGFEI